MTNFETLLDSVIPRNTFIGYIEMQKPKMVPYLKMIQICKLYEFEFEELDLIKQGQTYLEGLIQKSNSELESS